jgi:hypothetical protein
METDSLPITCPKASENVRQKEVLSLMGERFIVVASQRVRTVSVLESAGSWLSCTWPKCQCRVGEREHPYS